MEKGTIERVVRQEIERLNEEPVIKDIHLHIHGDGLASTELLQGLVSIQNTILEKRVLEVLKDLSEELRWQRDNR